MKRSAWLSTPIGWLLIEGSELGVSKVKKTDRPDGAAVSPLDLPDGHPVAACRAQLEAYFEGQRTAFDIKLDWSGANEFSRNVWQALCEIPFGKTRSYSEIAEKLGCPDAVRAVGMANRNNPIAIVVPCHRVIGKSGELRGYFYGLDVKMQLLRHENPSRFAEQGALF